MVQLEQKVKRDHDPLVNLPMNNKIICTKVMVSVIIPRFIFVPLMNPSDYTLYEGDVANCFFYNVFVHSKRRILIGLQINSFRW